MTSASPREIRFNWYWESGENIRAQRVLQDVAEEPRWPFVARWALAAGAVESLLLIAGAPGTEQGRLALLLLPVLFACAYALFSFSEGLFAPAHAYWEKPAEWSDLPDLFQKGPNAEHPITVTISDEGYSTDSHRGPGGRAWKYFQGVRETDEFLLFLLEGRGGHYIPKRAVPADGLEAIRGILRTHFGERARLMSAPASPPQLQAPPPDPPPGPQPSFRARALIRRSFPAS
jgi:hypothetical protein